VIQQQGGVATLVEQIGERLIFKPLAQN